MQKTRKFTYLLLRWAFKKQILSGIEASDIAYKLMSFLKQEDPGITEITAYRLFEPRATSSEIYFIISNPAYPPDTHMVLPLKDNPLMEATFVDADAQHAQEFLNQFYGITHIF